MEAASWVETAETMIRSEVGEADGESGGEERRSTRQRRRRRTEGGGSGCVINVRCSGSRELDEWRGNEKRAAKRPLE